MTGNKLKEKVIQIFNFYHHFASNYVSLTSVVCHPAIHYGYVTLVKEVGNHDCNKNKRRSFSIHVSWKIYVLASLFVYIHKSLWLDYTYIFQYNVHSSCACTHSCKYLNYWPLFWTQCIILVYFFPLKSIGYKALYFICSLF